MRSWRSSSHSRAISSRPISSRASRSWWRTRNCRKPSALRNASAASTWRSLSAVMRSPYWKRDDRHANEGLSQVGNPSARERSRISCLVSPASIMGARTPRCFADHRPGMQSAKQRGVRAPMIEAGLTKQEIRDLSRALGLPTWDKPSFACLSSRFQYGDRITADKLRQVDAAEAFLKALGFRQFRVRHHDRLARLEIGRDEMARLWEDDRHERIVARFRELGYVYVAVDLAGFQSGSANLLLRLRSNG